MAVILCIETSSTLCSVAVSIEDKIYYKESPRAQAHAEVISGLIKEALHEAGLNFKDLDAVAVSGGPGSYTGLRIGTSTAKGLCFALQIPLISIDTLKIIAHAALVKGSKGFLWPMIDARRMEVYHAVYNDRLELVRSPESGIITEEGFMSFEPGQEMTMCGDGAPKAIGIVDVPYTEVVLNAAAMCALAKEAFQDQAFVDLTSFEPFYLKQANITGPAAAKS
jgi:tRNA threonylcarbamoyladenosine biosynthesis protein TsaB